jgi:hypothetical protein
VASRVADPVDLRLEVAVLAAAWAHLYGDGTDEIPVDYFPTLEAVAIAATLTPAELNAGAAAYMARIAAQRTLSREGARAAWRISGRFRARADRLVRWQARVTAPVQRHGYRRAPRRRRASTQRCARAPAGRQADPERPVARRRAREVRR